MCFVHKSGCKVTNFLSITQIKIKKTDNTMHKYHAIVHFFIPTIDLHHLLTATKAVLGKQEEAAGLKTPSRNLGTLLSAACQALTLRYRMCDRHSFVQDSFLVHIIDEVLHKVLFAKGVQRVIGGDYVAEEDARGHQPAIDLALRQSKPPREVSYAEYRKIKRVLIHRVLVFCKISDFSVNHPQFLCFYFWAYKSNCVIFLWNYEAFSEKIFLPLP